MLNSKVYVYQPASLGGGQYTIDLYFLDPAKPVFLNLGDYVKDTASNEYQIISPTVIPHVDGATVRVQYITSDVIPVEDSDYNSDVYTPNQVDRRPLMRTAGSLVSPSLYYGPNYEYTITAGWSTPAEEAKAAVGDRIVDFSGKEYEITFIDPTNRFTVPCRIKEVERVGITPTIGDATMYTPTPIRKFFQGTEMGDPARTNIFNRDKTIIDEHLGGGSSNGDWQQVTHVITAGEASAKQITIVPTPADSSEVVVLIHGAPIPSPTVDYTITNGVFDWNGLGLDGILAENDKVIFNYFSNF